MKLILQTKDFTYIKEKSTYNHNYYLSDKGIEILEIDHEDYNYQEYRLIEGQKWSFLGCSQTDLGMSGEEVIEIDFKEFYT